MPSNTKTATAKAHSPAANLSDLGNSRRFADFVKGTLLYTESLGWLRWDGCRWERVNEMSVLQLAREIPTRIVREAFRKAEKPDPQVFGWARTSESESKLKAMVSLARSDPLMLKKAEDFDSNPLLLNVVNGTLNLDSGKIRSHRPTDLITRLAPVRFDSDATCPRFEKFLREVFRDDKDLMRFVQVSVGYSLTGRTNDQVFFLLHGTGANGKSVFVETIRALLGEYASTADFSTFSLSPNRSGIRNDLARLDGARFVTASESGQGTYLDESVIKQLTGGDPITARYLYKEHFEFVPQFKMWLVTNHMPRLKDGGYAMWRRIRVLPFNATIPPEKRDGRLLDKLKAEMPGILNWAIEGCRAWLKGGLPQNKTVASAVESYRKETDQIETFLESECVRESGAKVNTTLAYERFSEHCRDTGQSPDGRAEFVKRLESQGLQRARSGSGGQYEWHGLRLNNVFAQVSEAPVVENRVADPTKPTEPTEPESNTFSIEESVDEVADSGSGASVLARAESG